VLRRVFTGLYVQCVRRVNPKHGIVFNEHCDVQDWGHVPELKHMCDGVEEDKLKDAYPPD